MLTNVVNDEDFKMDGKITNIYDGTSSEEIFTASPFKNFIEHLFDLKLKYEEEGKNFLVDLMEFMYKLVTCTIKKGKKSMKILSWVLKFNQQKTTMSGLLIMNLYQVVNMLLKKSDHGSDKIKEVWKSMQSFWDIFVLSHSESIMKILVHNIDQFQSKKVYYQVTDSLYIHIYFYEKLKRVGYIGKFLKTRKKWLWSW